MSNLRIQVPTGRWLRRTDNRDDIERYPILAYGLEDGTFVIFNDGDHVVSVDDECFPANNWEIWNEVEA